MRHLHLTHPRLDLWVTVEIWERDGRYMATADLRKGSRDLGLGDTPQAAMHYWSQKSTELSHNRRSAAVLFGQPGARASLVAVVDLLDGMVSEIVAAEQR